LQNLGEAELRTGRNVEAARHFTAFLRASSSGSPAQRELAKRSLAKAAERLGSIVVTTNVDDAEIRIDDELVGRSPLGSLIWYVDPGRHSVTARKDGYLDGSERIDVAIGPPRSVLVRVQRVIGGTSEAPPEEVKPAMAPVAPSARVVNDTGAAPFNVSVESRHTPTPARTVVLLSGAALTAAGVAVGTVYAVRAGTDATSIRDAQAQLPELSAKYGGSRTAGEVCSAPVASADDDFCGDLGKAFDRQHTDQQVRNIAFIGAGVIGVATLATVFLWRTRPAAVSIAPALSPSAPGWVVFGRF
jgi:hypothetical protein